MTARSFKLSSFEAPKGLEDLREDTPGRGREKNWFVPRLMNRLVPVCARARAWQEERREYGSDKAET
jgi:hypothetical protein